MRESCSTDALLILNDHDIILPGTWYDFWAGVRVGAACA